MTDFSMAKGYAGCGQDGAERATMRMTAYGSAYAVRTELSHCVLGRDESLKSHHRCVARGALKINHRVSPMGVSRSWLFRSGNSVRESTCAKEAE